MRFLVCEPPAPGGLPPHFFGHFAMSVTQFVRETGSISTIL